MTFKYSNYYQTDDNEKILYSTNFEPKENPPYKNVLVFNYGLVCSNFHWKYQLPYFDSLGYKILIHDYRGHYQSTCHSGTETITIENIANDLVGILNLVNIESCVLLGHSMGVNVSLEATKKLAHRVQALILLSGTIIPVDNVMLGSNIMDNIKPVILDFFKKYPDFLNGFWKLGGWNPVIKKIIHFGGFNTDTVPKDFIEVYLNKLGELGPDIFFQLLNQMHSHDILAHINSINQKTLIIGGDDDKVIPNYLQKLLHERIPTSELYILRHGSHVPQVDFPELVNERIELFLDKNLS